MGRLLFWFLLICRRKFFFLVVVDSSGHESCKTWQAMSGHVFTGSAYIVNFVLILYLCTFNLSRFMLKIEFLLTNTLKLVGVLLEKY